MNANADTQTISLDLPYPPERVWRALTDPELLATWLMATDMRPLVGNSFTFKAQPTPWWDGPANASAFDGARKGWQRMVGEGLPEVLARTA